MNKTNDAESFLLISHHVIKYRNYILYCTNGFV